jgi:Tol biopolymer transport system component
MTLSSGTRLGPYEILAAIGAGGMGEVYKARDTRLDRTVAIKVLPPEFSADPERRARFEREAKTIAGLNHPHICTLHDVGEHEGSTFLVMEHLTGETLAQRLEKGPLPPERALTVATEIADALGAAHRQGILHRDLKPGNVMLTKTGAKLLDFGLAKLKTPAPDSPGLSSLPTQVPATAQGTILGTVPYMAPEQLEGRPTDARTDLFAFGAMLYEILTGKRAFEGTSQASVIAAIMSAEPAPVSSLRPRTPPLLDRLVKKCLAKDPDDRWASAHDVADELRWMRETGGVGALAGVQPRRRRGLRTALVLAGVLVAAMIGAGVVWLVRPPASPAAPRPATFAILLPANDRLEGASGVTVAPDGSRIAYVALRNGVRQLFLRSIDRLDLVAVSGSEGADAPFFSPDGQWLGFFASGGLKKVSVDGGTPVTICEAGFRRGASWTDEDVIVFGSDTYPGLMRVSASGGAPAPLTAPDEKEWSHRWPETLPGRRAVVFTIAPAENPRGMQLGVLDIDSGRQRTLLKGSFPHFVPPGYLTFVRDESLWAVGFDPRRLTIIGEPVRAAEIVESYVGGFAEYGIGRDGTLVSRPPADEGGELTWVDRGGRATRITERTGLSTPALSPEGRRIAAELDGDVWVYDLDRGTFTRVTSGGTRAGQVEWAAWAPDGRRIMFSREQALYVVPADGSAPPVRLSPSNRHQRFGSWLSDGVTRVFADESSPSHSDIWIQPPSGPAVPIVATPANETMPAFSPDGRWLAYAAGDVVERVAAGQGYAVYVQAYPSGARLRVSTTDGWAPRWARNGRELFYMSPRGEIVSVPVNPKSSSVFGQPRVLFNGAFSPDFDVDLEGRRFLMTTRPGGRRLVVTLNWLEELRRRLPPIR